ncbi:MAG: UTP--glucose-1-phosphate uridylyltransferase [Caldilinea sp.]|uniref:UTP--glucose-1-phosphate uridylyltransferase n=1 Tax=Caldilinea sp. TaxID=2293560 RepID=UPI00309B34DB
MTTHQTTASAFAAFERKMRSAGLSQTFIDNFRFYYEQLVQGATGYISRQEAQPVEALPSYHELDASLQRAGEEALRRAFVLKLNGGLGTSMGIDGPKSLLPVKGELTFLDIIVRQVLALRKRFDVSIPLVLMNSFHTRDATLRALEAYPELKIQGVPLDFMQHMEPKVWKETLSPAEWPADPEKEWCPPGHGDIYPALIDSGMLSTLLDAGYEYAFVSNVDNLGAVLDLAILGHFAHNRIPFLMEVAQRTPADRKGGHLARSSDGRLILRESAQCPPEEEAEFQDIHLYRYFNTNNLWINLRALAETLERRHGVLGLPLIRNEKPIDPTDPTTPRVYQLETAMGSAIGVFEGAQAICVPRSRFAPVKKNSDLLVLMSDAYHLNEDYTLSLAPECNGTPPVATLDDRYYLLYEAMKARFPAGAPSLRRCISLTVRGDVTFGANVTVAGRVVIEAPEGEPLRIPDGAVLEEATSRDRS